MSQRSEAQEREALKRSLDGTAEIRSQMPNDAYREGWDRVFGKKDEETEGEVCDDCGGDGNCRHCAPRTDGTPAPCCYCGGMGYFPRN